MKRLLFGQVSLVWILSVALSFSALAESTTTVQWRPFADDLEKAELAISSRLFFSSSLTFLRTSLRSYRVGVIRAADFGSQRLDVKTLVKLGKARAGINANFFDTEGNPLGLVMSKGIVYQRIHRGGTTLTGIFATTRKGISIANRLSFTLENTLEAVQAGPRLLSGGRPVPGLHESLTPSKRAGVCIDGKGRLLFFAVSSRFIGLDIEELQNILAHPDIGCVDALNLDGGGSAQLYVAPNEAERVREISIEGEDQVPVALALFTKGL